MPPPDDEPSTEPRLRAALAEHWSAPPPPEDFIDRVMAARSAPAVRRARWPRVLAVAAAAALLVAGGVLIGRGGGRAATGALTATARTTLEIGPRARAVAEPGTGLSFQVARDGTTRVRQSGGNVFYRVDRAGRDAPFVVETAAAEIRVTGTCFRVAEAAGVLAVSVDEGAVAVVNRQGAVAVAAGEGAVVRTGARPERQALGDLALPGGAGNEKDAVGGAEAASGAGAAGKEKVPVGAAESRPGSDTDEASARDRAMRGALAGERALRGAAPRTRERAAGGAGALLDRTDAQGEESGAGAAVDRGQALVPPEGAGMRGAGAAVERRHALGPREGGGARGAGGAVDRGQPYGSAEGAGAHGAGGAADRGQALGPPSGDPTPEWLRAPPSLAPPALAPPRETATITFTALDREALAPRTASSPDPIAGAQDPGLLGYARAVHTRLLPLWRPVPVFREAFAHETGASRAEVGSGRTTTLRVRVGRSGAIAGVELDQPSGVAALDAEARAALVRAAPLPPPPTDLLDRYDELGLRLAFHLDLSITDFMTRLGRDVRQRWHPALPFMRFAGPGRSSIVRVAIDPSGAVTDAAVVQSSGVDHLDEAALRAVAPGTRVPPPPAALRAGAGPASLRLVFVPDPTGAGHVRAEPGER